MSFTGRESILAKKPKLRKILSSISMAKFYPARISLQDLYTITKESLEDKALTKTEELGWYFLRKICQYNYLARDLRITKPNSKEGKGTKEKPQLSLFKQKDPQTKSIHPLDVVAAVFLCCHPVCQQDIASRLWACKLSIPFILPIENEPLRLFLWPLRVCVMRWDRIKGRTIESVERCIVTEDIKCIAFIRLSESGFSKSAFINNIISDSGKTHPMFFHKNCPGSCKERLLIDGMVELGWFFPKGIESDNFPDAVCFSNLRGDARNHKTQVQILTTMANIIVIQCSFHDLQSSQALIKNMLDNKKSVLITLTDQTQSEEQLEIVKRIIEGFNADTEVLNIISVQDDRDPDLIKETRDILNTFRSQPNQSLENLVTGIGDVLNLDESNTDCRWAKNEAKQIIDIFKKHDPEKRKQTLLPLQGKDWGAWSSADKELQRQKERRKGEDFDEYSNKQETLKLNSRLKQLHKIQGGLPDYINKFVDVLLEKGDIECSYFLRWLKLMCDELSREDMPELVGDYRKLMQLLSAANKDDQEKLSKELDDLDWKMNQISIGLEDIAREIGQAFECLKACSQNEKHKLQEMYYQMCKLPKVATKLLQHGYPVEIMDGDAGAVPMKWNEYVLQNILEQLRDVQGKNDIRVLVLSILGIQSSGKSTLLNTMFGLKFAVRAGRCTKGVYMQLVKVDDGLKDQIPVDYIIAVDTEGLKSPDLSSESCRRHDNELATFVIGLGDVTLMNLMGENTVVLEEILPISVHAFLRMEKVGLHPKCLVVHQNVDKKNEEKLFQQQRTLEKKLNSSTEIACGFEMMEKKIFKDLIDFNINEDVDYVPTFLEGSQPMSPVSVDYSMEANKVKAHLLPMCSNSPGKSREISSKINPRHYDSFETFIQRLADLWDAIKKDSFVFEFRNTLETQARGKLDKEWSNISTRFCQDVTAPFTRKAYTSIMNSPSRTDLNEMKGCMTLHLKDLLGEGYERHSQKLKSFFDNADNMYQEFLFKWKFETEERLRELERELERECKAQLESFYEICRRCFDIQEERARYESDLVSFIEVFVQKEKTEQRVKQLAYDEAKLERIFEDQWLSWVQKVCETHKPNEQEINIEMDVYDALLEKMATHKELLQKKKKQKRLSEYRFGNFKAKQNHWRYKYQDRLKLTRLFDILPGQGQKEECITKQASYVMENAGRVLRDIEDAGEPYNTGMVAKVLDEINPEPKDEHRIGNDTIVVTNQYTIDLAVHIAGETISSLEKMHNEVREKHKPEAVLHQAKDRYFMLFKLSFDQTNILGAIATDIKDIVQSGIIDKVQKDLPRRIIDIAQTKTHVRELGSKKSFIMDVVYRLAKKNDFGLFFNYIHFPREHMRMCLEGYFDECCDELQNKTPRLESLAAKMMDDILACVCLAINDVSRCDESNCSDLKTWLQYFRHEAKDNFIVQGLESHSFPKTDTFQVEPFTRELLKQIDMIEKNQKTLLKLVLSDSARQRYKELFLDNVEKNVIGCTEKCPFCGEICIRATADHGSCEHETPIHRPQGCTGYHNHESKELVPRPCTTSVASDRIFRINDKRILYKAYKTEYPQWKIAADPSIEASSFWTWFFVDHIDRLAATYEVKKPDIPDTMRMFSRKEEMEKLRKESCA